MLKFLSKAILIGAAMTPIPACVMGSPAMAEEGFAPAYVGAGVTQAVDNDATATEGSLFGAYRAKAINAPVTVRGYLLPFDGVEAGASLTYDYGAAKNLNVFAGPGFVHGSDQTFATVGGGVEWNQEGTPIVLFGSYARAFGNDAGFNMFQFGTAYQF